MLAILVILKRIKDRNMFSFTSKIRVRYGETDRMGYAYYGNYALYFEVGRVETLKELGFSYKKLEDGGVLLPVKEFHINYLKPALYDDLLSIITYVEEIKGAKIKFKYETYNEQKELLNEASTTLVFVDAETRRPVKAPKEMIEQISAHLK